MKKAKNWKEFLARLPDDTTIAGWDGGNDSGSVDLDNAVPSEYVDDVSDAIYDALGYAGWDGSFSSCGNVKKDTDGERPVLILNGDYEDQESYEYDPDNEDSADWVVPEAAASISQGIDVIERLPTRGEGDLGDDEVVLAQYRDGPVPDEAADALQKVCSEANEFIHEWYDSNSAQEFDSMSVSSSYQQKQDGPMELRICCSGGHYRHEDVFHEIDLSGPYEEDEEAT
jgi:hypothetical protein